MNRERPASIIWFDRFFFAYFLLTFVDLFIHRETYFSEDEMLVDEVGFVFLLAVFGGILLFSGIQIVLWFFAAYRARNWAKWLYILFFALGLASILPSMTLEFSVSEWAFVVLTQLLALGSILCLFTPEARFWFKTKGILPVGKEEKLSDIFE